MLSSRVEPCNYYFAVWQQHRHFLMLRGWTREYRKPKECHHHKRRYPPLGTHRVTPCCCCYSPHLPTYPWWTSNSIFFLRGGGGIKKNLRDRGPTGVARVCLPRWPVEKFVAQDSRPSSFSIVVVVPLQVHIIKRHLTSRHTQSQGGKK